MGRVSAYPGDPVVAHIFLSCKPRLWARGRAPSQGEGVIRCLKLVYVIVFLAVVGWAVDTARAEATAARSPVSSAARMPKRWHAPRWWLRQAVCIHSKEGAWNAATGNGYEGGMQFLASTYQRVGGRVRYDRYGHPWHWASLDSPREQLYRAWLVYRQDGSSWREWGTARACGLR